MNSNFAKSTSSQRGGGGGGGGSVSLNSFDFDLGFSSNRPRSLSDQKHPSSSSSSSSSFSSQQIRHNTTSSWQPNKPSWIHQPARGPSTRPGLTSAPTSMVGDISGRSWASAAPSGSATTVGIVNKNPNLFGDLLNSALVQDKSNVNVPLKNAAVASTPMSSKGSYSMGNLADSLPKTGQSVKNSSSWGSSESFGSYASSINSKRSNNVITNPSLGGPSMRSSGGIGGGMSTKKDPFGSLVDFGSKEAAKSNRINRGDDIFGDFQNASKATTQSYPSSANPPSSTNTNNIMGSSSTSSPKMDDFGISDKDYASQSQPPIQPTGGVPLDMFFNSSASATAAPSAAQGIGDQQFSEVDDWGLDSGLGGGGIDESTTIELEGLPPPPAGVSASAAMNKGMDNHKQGQFADAIKWLSWAVILFEKVGDGTSIMEVLSSRASCYKEVGEYKKAVADCTKALERDEKNVLILVQRALLYESMEKYKLGAEDLRTVMKHDPGNRVARSTIHRLTKMAE